jgi:hypothetical protein
MISGGFCAGLWQVERLLKEEVNFKARKPQQFEINAYYNANWKVRKHGITAHQ